ncbi:O-fucosyltransferase family protein [Cyclobacterium amurskyense]|uniref:Uncharacterized protein n=1 Tax=Cyclobacterium amurskyense TaxID=320787 RepID=A0A0H4PJB3_9BACT|nr:hypothetical protein [Cyclobacterium amurskyense]AKP53008.1 hypothetical protein CA2015_3631 [Cyclobacterium amurskyense]
MPKRSLPSFDRLKLLKQKNVKYIVTCYQNEFFCENHPKGKCTRGFFSLFLQVVYGIGFAKEHGLPLYVDFGNVTYPYSKCEVSNEPNNFWDKLVDQPLLTSMDVPVPNKEYEVYPLRIWNRNHYRYLHQLMLTGIKFRNELRADINEVKIRMAKLKTLGVHIRKTDHFQEVTPVKDKVFFRQIEKKITNYDRLFVATDDSEMLAILKGKFPDKIMANDCVRSVGSQPIHHKEGQKDGFLLAKEALMDCITLSNCDELILSPSNLSYAALVFNPEVNYTIVESHAAKWNRLKTLLAFHLDRLGIRKW